MKKLKSIILLSTLCLTSVISYGKEVNLKGVMVDGNFLAPMRAVFEELGATVEWYPEGEIIIGKKDPIKISMQVGSKIAGKTNHATDQSEGNDLVVAPMIIDGSTYVPFRYVGESLGAVVGYENGIGTITQGDIIINLSNDVEKSTQIAEAKKNAYKVIVNAEHFYPGEEYMYLSNDEGIFIQPDSQFEMPLVFQDEQIKPGNWRLVAEFDKSGRTMDIVIKDKVTTIDWE